MAAFAFLLGAAPAEAQDTTAPTLAGAERYTHDPTIVRLTFDEDIQVSPRPDRAAFTFTVDGANRAVALVDTDSTLPRFVHLHLSGSDLTDGNVVTLSYDPSRAGGATKAIQDLAGNRATGWKNWLVKTDFTAPALESAAVNGTALTLTWNETVDPEQGLSGGPPPAICGLPFATCPTPPNAGNTSSGPPPASAFTVKGIGANQTPSGVSVSGNVVTLTLERGATAGQTVTVSYAKPSSNPLRDVQGNAAANLVNRAVTNDTPRVGPRPSRITATSQDIYIHFDGEAIRTGATGTHPMSGQLCPASQAFTLKVNGKAQGSWATRGVEVDAGGGNGLDGWRAKCDAGQIHLELWNGPGFYLIPPGSTVTLSYDPERVVTGPEAGRITYADGSVVPAFTDMAVDSSAISYLNWTQVNGTDLLAYFGLSLDPNSVPPPSAFTVTVGGERRNVVSGGVGFFGLYDGGVKLTLESPVHQGEAVTLSYDAPATGGLRGKNRGSVVPSFSGVTVRNESTGSAPGTAIWSATLTVKALHHPFIGCLEGIAAARCATALTDDDFEFGGVTYQVLAIGFHPVNGTLDMTLDREWSTAFPSTASLQVGGNTALLNRTQRSNNDRTLLWTNREFRLSLGDEVVLRLTTGSGSGGASGTSGPSGPSPRSSSVSGTQLKMTFDGTLSQGLAPPGGSFKVTADSGTGAGAFGGAFALGGAFGTGAQATSGVRATSGNGADDIPGTGTATVNGTEVVVTLAQAAPPGSTLTVAYTPPDDGVSALRGLQGGKVEEFSEEPVTNGSAAVAPAVTAVAVVSDAGDDDTYALGETIRVAVRFSAAVEVDVSGGAPYLTIDMDPADWGAKRAAYESGSGTAELVFAHEVVEPNHSTEGIAVLADSLTANGGTIRSAADGTDAELAHAGLGHDPAHKVDWGLTPVNEAPEVDTEAAEYDAFTGAGNAPRGVHVSKPFNGLFSDPDGDELTYTVALADPGQAVLVELLAIPTEEDLGEQADDVRLAQRVHYRADAEGDWEALDPVPPNPVSVVVTVTATDPGGLSASVDGVFQTTWERLTTPSVTGVAVTSDPGPGDTYRLGDTIRVALTFDEAVAVAGAPALSIDMDPADWGEKRAAYEGGSGTATLTFAYTVVEPNYSEPGIAVLADSLSLEGGSIRSAATGGDADLSHAGLAHDAAHQVNWQQTRPSATGVRISSRPASGDTYRYGETIRVAVAFSEAVDVSGTPRIRIDMDPADWGAKWAEYESGGGTATLTFRHTVVEPNYSTQGIAVLADTLEANGGAIRSAATAVDAALSHGGLGHDPAHKVNWLPGLSVADAKAKEGEDAAVEFVVRLARAATQTVTVDYATADGSAKAGEDYTAASGTLTFAVGESSKTIAVAVLDDAHDEGEETFTLRLSNAAGAWLEDAEAVGTIENADLIPAALLARFGRAAAEQVVETVEERLSARRERGFRARLAGREFTPGNEREFALGFLTQFAPGSALATGAGGASPATGTHTAGLGSLGAGADTTGTRGAMGGADMGSGMGQGLSLNGGDRGGLFGGDLLSSSGFELNRDSRGGTLSVWSRSARSYFTGMEDALSLNGDVRTTMVGADWARGPLTLGLSVGHSLGLGGYAGARGGQMSTSLTGFYPWVGYEVNDRVSVWGVTGYGKGSLSLTPEGAAALETGVSMAMTAVGTRGELLGPGSGGGLSLAFKADALWVGAASDLLESSAGRLNASEAGVTRVRTALEGSRGFTLGGGRVSLTPTVEVGVRRDGGDAETGAGLDVGGGLAFADAVTGMSLDVRVRTLVVHEAEGFTERGLSLSFGWNPTPSSPLGPSARIAPSWGGSARGGAEALWSGQMAHGVGSYGMHGSAGRLDAEVGYGLPMGARLVGTPSLGLRTSEYGRDYRAGYRVGVLEQGRLQFDLGLEAQRREAAMQGGPSNAFLARATLGW